MATNAELTPRMQSFLKEAAHGALHDASARQLAHIRGRVIEVTHAIGVDGDAWPQAES